MTKVFPDGVHTIAAVMQSGLSPLKQLAEAALQSIHIFSLTSVPVYYLFSVLCIFVLFMFFLIVLPPFATAGGSCVAEGRMTGSILSPSNLLFEISILPSFNSLTSPILSKVAILSKQSG